MGRKTASSRVRRSFIKEKLRAECKMPKRKEVGKLASRYLMVLRRYDLYLHGHFAVAGTVIVATNGWDVGVVTPMANLHVSFIELTVVGGIQTAPAMAGNENIHPSMAGAGFFRGQIAADIARGNFESATKPD